MSLLEVLPHQLNLTKYKSLAEHQSSTPSSFFDAPPVLHFRAENCKIQIPSDLLFLEGPLRAVFGPPPASIINSPPKVPVQINFEGVHVVAASNAFLFSSQSTNKTLSIPYPLITLHAIQHSPSLSSPTSKLFSIYLQISTAASSSEDDDLIELIITPHLPAYSKSSTVHTTPDGMAIDPNPEEASHSQESLTKAMFAALTRCADLHPTNSSSAMGFFDDEDEEDDDGTDDEQEDAIAFEGPVGYGDEMDVDHAFTKIKKKSSKGFIGSAGFPGDGGWITSENVHLLEKVKIEGGLGPGAGSVRQREDDDDDEDEIAANGNGELSGGKEGTETKWRKIG